jgi:peroxiredoxin
MRNLRALALFLICFSAVAWADSMGFPSSGQAVHPVVLGSSFPAGTVSNLEGKAVTLSALQQGKAAVVVFYRGGWCPYCNVQLSNLRKIIEPLKAKGVQLIAVSPDSVASLKKTMDKEPLPYALVSDAKLEWIKALGIGFQLDAETIKKYQGYGIDLAQASGEKHHVLPVPSVFVVDAKGIIQFHYVNPDYSKRVPEALIMSAVDTTLALKPLK